MRILVSLILATFLGGSATLAQEKKRSQRKVQEIDFAEMSLKGTVRNPEGAFLVQKRGINFLPLIEVNQDMDSRIRNSTQYVK